MHRACLEIELLEDCVFSARAATEGGHESLDRIPGAALLGAAAARLYAGLGTEAFTAFHSGRLRFGDGLPLAPSGAAAWPVPRAWHHPKNAALTGDDNRLRKDLLFNFTIRNEIPEQEGRRIQPKQLRQGHVTGYGEWVRPRRDLRLKTAIEATTGRAAEGQLFGYDALHRGQVFRAWIEADETVDAALFERVVEALTNEVLLGRSRSAEYGRARIARVEAEPPRPGDPAPDGRLRLWLLSDLALVDAQGQPTLQPTPGHFGLDGGEILWDRTFLRARRYSPWNAARGGFDRERLVLEAGSVLTIAPSPGYDREALIERLARGVGRHREAGLGRFWLDPPLLADDQPAFAAPPEPAAADAKPTAPPDHPLVAWLQDQGSGWKLVAEREADRFVEDYFDTIKKARRFGGIAKDAVFGPSRSQWGQVLATARACRGNTLHGALFNGDDAVIKENGEGWDIDIDGRHTLAGWLRERLDPTIIERSAEIQDKDRHRAYAHFVRMSARRIQDRIRRRRT
ncbi:MAG TPA: hypothetical protein ENJ38_12205 [Rhodospirillales bacterium]|nr:hypothetical protein [Rhodospirillales bacterium]